MFLFLLNLLGLSFCAKEKGEKNTNQKKKAAYLYGMDFLFN